jgi:hypothetical protein
MPVLLEEPHHLRPLAAAAIEVVRDASIFDGRQRDARGAGGARGALEHLRPARSLAPAAGAGQRLHRAVALQRLVQCRRRHAVLLSLGKHRGSEGDRQALLTNS